MKQSDISSNLTNYEQDKQKIIDFMSDGKLAKWRDIEDIIQSPNSIIAMVKNNDLEKVRWGTYKLNEELILSNDYAYKTELDSFADLTRRSKHAVFYLYSAASYHGISLDNPGAIWFQLPKNAHYPKNYESELKPYFCRKELNLKVGIEEIDHFGTKVKITNKERTIFDLFRHKNKLADSTTARRALTWYYNSEDFNPSELYKIAFKLDKSVLNEIRTAIELLNDFKVELDNQNSGGLSL